MNNLITFFSNFKYFKKYLFDEIKRMTAERLLGKKLNEFVVNKNILNSKPNQELLEKYKKVCERNTTVNTSHIEIMQLINNKIKPTNG